MDVCGYETIVGNVFGRDSRVYRKAMAEVLAHSRPAPHRDRETPGRARPIFSTSAGTLRATLRPLCLFLAFHFPGSHYAAIDHADSAQHLSASPPLTDGQSDCRGLLQFAAAPDSRRHLSVVARIRKATRLAGHRLGTLPCGRGLYWNKHLLYRVPELRSAKRLLFLDNDVFTNREAGPLLQDWDSPLIGATTESSQAGWSQDFIASYYSEYSVDQSERLPNPQIINTGVLVIPREQAEFLERVYQAWKKRRELNGGAKVERPVRRRR